MRSAKVWAFEGHIGRLYKVKFDSGGEERFACRKGLTARESFKALHSAIEESLGEPCWLVIMNRLAFESARQLAGDAGLTTLLVTT